MVDLAGGPETGLLPPRRAFREGVRHGTPYAVACGVVAISFGVLARELGFSVLGAAAMSALVYAGGAQFAALAVLSAGGSVASCVGSAALVNSRYLPMGIALAPSLTGGRLRRAMQGQPMVDSSWVHAKRPDGSFDRWLLYGSSVVQYLAWTGGTILGAVTGEFADAEALGLDAVFPAFFVALLMKELTSRRAVGVAIAAGFLALALVPHSPAGVPVLAAGAIALIGIRQR
ncbi:MAG: AzlC family ABC transporter permease [Sporichthyaceae bacterium]